MTSKGSADGAQTQAGELVQLEYDLWAETAGKTELLDTTSEETAQGAGLQTPAGTSWGARPHQVGGEYFPKGIEDALVGAKLGHEFEKEFAPAEAFGERDPNLIELFSMHEIERLPEMRRENAHLDLGTVLTINGRRGRVTTLTAARVRVDFNPPYAGRKIRGKFKVVGKITEPVDQARAIVELHYGHGKDFGIEMAGKALTLKVPERAKFDPGWIVAKARVIDRLRSQVNPETIHVVEEYARPKEAKSEAAKGEEKPAVHAHEPSEKHAAKDEAHDEKTAKHEPAKKPAHAHASETSGSHSTKAP
jgi:FKBP-type peptidyl-prolyl cis-trans isomerase 2